MPKGRHPQRRDDGRPLPAPDVEAVRIEELLTRAEETEAVAEVRRRERTFRWALASADMLAAAFTVFAVMTVHAGKQLGPTYLLVVPLVVLVAKLQGLYDRDELVIHKTTLEELPRLVNVATLLALIVWLARHFIIISEPSTEDLLLLWVLFGLSMAVGRVIARVAAGRLSPPERCFVVGDTTMSERIRSKLGYSANVDLVGWLDPQEIEISDSTLLGLMEREHVHRLVIAVGHPMDEAHTLHLVRMAKGVGMRVTLVPSILAVVGSSVVFDDLWGMQVLGIQRFGLTRSSRAIKRTLDLAVAGFGLFAIAPLLAVIALVIKLDSPGPALFRQRRTGRRGIPFTILKFRTMVVGADEMKADLHSHNEADGLFKMLDDPRDHARRAHPAQDLSRRAPPALQCAARRDEPSRATSPDPRRGRQDHRLRPAAPER